jgi:hypothetical protein
MRIFFVLLFFALQAQAQETAIFQRPPKEKMSATIVDVASQFIGKPYVAATLEKTPEALVINLKEFDCFTLVENVLAISLAKHNPEAGFDIYREYLQLLRYREGVIDGYGSRLHYFLEWARQATENGFLMNITEDIGEVDEREIHFMSTNRKLYPALQSDPKAFDAIVAAEKVLNEGPMYYIPKDRFKDLEGQILDGDIIAFTSSVKGLDVNHEGFAVRKNGKLHLLHASLEQKKVILSTETLEQYLNRIKKHTGIMVFRVTKG